MSLSSLNRILMAHFLKKSFPKLAHKERTIVNCSHSIVEMHPRVVLRRENVPRGPEVVSRWSKLIEQTLQRLGDWNRNCTLYFGDSFFCRSYIGS